MWLFADKKSKKNRKQVKHKNCLEEKEKHLIEETIPAMVTIKRVVENNYSPPTVTITLKGSTPDEDKLLYTLVNGYTDESSSNGGTKSSKKNKQAQMQQPTVKIKDPEINVESNPTKKKNKSSINRQDNSKEVKVTLAVNNPASVNGSCNKKKKEKSVKNNVKTSNDAEETNLMKTNSKDKDLSIPMLRLPPGR